jgi:diacylglycerol kinase family enzyme
MNILGAGLIADILKLTNERLKFLGSFGYSLAVLVRLFKGMNNRIRLKVDGVEHFLKDSALVISNSKFTGGKMKIAPMAKADDGRVDIIVFNEVGRLDILKIFSRVFKGDHVNHEKVRVFSGKDIEIESDPPLRLMADGELLGNTPLTLKVLPGRQKILI